MQIAAGYLFVEGRLRIDPEVERDRPASIRLGEHDHPEAQRLAIGEASYVVGVFGLGALYLGRIDQDEGTLGIVEPHQRLIRAPSLGKVRSMVR